MPTRILATHVARKSFNACPISDLGSANTETRSSTCAEKFLARDILKLPPQSNSLQAQARCREVRCIRCPPNRLHHTRAIRRHTLPRRSMSPWGRWYDLARTILRSGVRPIESESKRYSEDKDLVPVEACYLVRPTAFPVIDLIRDHNLK